jgi:hypothetical protein
MEDEGGVEEGPEDVVEEEGLEEGAAPEEVEEGAEEGEHGASGKGREGAMEKMGPPGAAIF